VAVQQPEAAIGLGLVVLVRDEVEDVGPHVPQFVKRTGQTDPVQCGASPLGGDVVQAVHEFVPYARERRRTVNRFRHVGVPRGG
jgi:hypothetical protein